LARAAVIGLESHVRNTKRLILRIACVAAVAVCALLGLEVARLVPPVGFGWGDAAAGRAYSVRVEGPIVFQTAAGMKTPPPGSYPYAVQSLGRWDRAGVSYHRWDMTAGRGPSAPVLGTFAEVRVTPAWPWLLSLSVLCLCVLMLAKERRAARGSEHCRHCGYDLRATPDRCPECGSIPASPAGV
jgi:hypothetical protein